MAGEPFHLGFAKARLELSVVELGDPADHLLIDSWHPGRGLSRTRR